MQDMTNTDGWSTPKPTAALVLADGTVIMGQGVGAIGRAEGEVCFNTAITGYEEILTDPSYAGQIITFTFPHIGNVGVNQDDIETVDLSNNTGVRGAVFRADVTTPSNFRATGQLDDWMKTLGIVGIAQVDTRALTAVIRNQGMQNAVIAHDPEGNFDIEALKRQAAAVPDLEGLDLAAHVTTDKPFDWNETTWSLSEGHSAKNDGLFHIVALDFGIKRNILRLLTDADCRVSVLPANATGNEILALNPDGVFLSNGPGDPAATGDYAVDGIRQVIDADIPVFGICLGHQMLALALGAKTVKMHQGHHGANHPVRDNTTGKVEITSMNHGFAVDGSSLPDNVEETHISLFDQSNCGLSVKGKPVFSVQYHPEASPGPRDSHYLFKRFTNLIRKKKNLPLVEEFPQADPVS
ncbi:MAG: glutamine-hydrolyzing carbamoyl-phosphate synthase small subunit [Stappiaceae bacterium]